MTYDSLNDLHPLTAFLFFSYAEIITMSTNNPIITAISLTAAGLYSLRLSGKKALLTIFKICLIIPLTGAVNFLTVHTGAHVLFYLNGNPMTLEAMLRGFLNGLIIIAVILWFMSENKIITDEKMIWLFGSVAPKTGLTISMMLRYIPMLKRRFTEVHSAEIAMGHDGHSGFGKMRQSAREFDCVLTWSLETSIERGNAMEERGYGIGKRTSYMRYHIKKSDIPVIAVESVLASVCLFLIIKGVGRFTSYPMGGRKKTSLMMAFSATGLEPLLYLLAALLFILPLCMEVVSEIRWKRGDDNA